MPLHACHWQTLALSPRGAVGVRPAAMPACPGAHALCGDGTLARAAVLESPDLLQRIFSRLELEDRFVACCRIAEPIVSLPSRAAGHA